MKYTKTKVNVILKALKEGKGKVESAQLAGIAYKTLWEWYNTYPSFRDAVDEILLVNKELLKHESLEYIKQAGKTNWTASAWILERIFPEEFSLRNRIDIEHNIKQLVINVSEEDTKKLIEKATDFIAGGGGSETLNLTEVSEDEKE